MTVLEKTGGFSIARGRETGGIDAFWIAVAAVVAVTFGNVIQRPYFIRGRHIDVADIEFEEIEAAEAFVVDGYTVIALVKTMVDCDQRRSC